MRLDQIDLEILKTYRKDAIAKHLSILLILSVFSSIVYMVLDKSEKGMSLGIYILLMAIYLGVVLRKPFLDIDSGEKRVKKGTITDSLEMKKEGYNLDGGPDFDLTEYYLMIDDNHQITVEKGDFDKVNIGDEIDMYYSKYTNKFIRLGNL